MPQLNRTVSGLLLREDFSAANGWTAGTGFSTVADPALVTWGALPQVMLAPRDVGQADYDGVREGQLYIEGGTWYLLYDAGDGTTGWREFIATSTDRGVTWSRAVQSIQLDNGSSGSYAAVANGWLEKRGATYYIHRVTAGSTFTSPNTGLPYFPYGWDQWSCSSINGTYTFTRITTGTGWCATLLVPGSVVQSGGTYYAILQGQNSTTDKIGYATASSPAGAWTINGTPWLADTNFYGFDCENPKLFWHESLGRWIMLLNAIDLGGSFTGRNVVALSASLTDWSASTQFHTMWYQAVCDTTGNAIGVQAHVTGPDGALIQEQGFVPFVYDADPRASSPGWHRGRSIRGAVYEPSAYKLAYSDATTTRNRYNKTFSHTDFVAEFEVNSAGLVAGSDISFEFRTNGTTGYRLMVRNETGGTLRLEKMDATTIQNGSGTALTSGVSLRIKVKANGTTLQAWLNGEKQIDTTDATYGSGTEVAFSGKNCTAAVRLLHIRSSDTLTVRGLMPSASVWLRSHGQLPVAQIAADGSGVATYAGTHYPLARVECDAGNDAQTPDFLLWGGDDVTYDAGGQDAAFPIFGR